MSADPQDDESMSVGRRRHEPFRYRALTDAQRDELALTRLQQLEVERVNCEFSLAETAASFVGPEDTRDELLEAHMKDLANYDARAAAIHAYRLKLDLPRPGDF